MKYITLICSLFLISGCVKKSRVDRPTKVIKDNFRDLIIYEDPKHNVICYRVESREGISCLQINK